MGVRCLFRSIFLPLAASHLALLLVSHTTSLSYIVFLSTLHFLLSLLDLVSGLGWHSAELLYRNSGGLAWSSSVYEGRGARLRLLYALVDVGSCRISI